MKKKKVSKPKIKFKQPKPPKLPKVMTKKTAPPPSQGWDDKD